MPIHSAFLRYFDEVCKSGSIRKAANKLYVASSAVNRQILKIEDELGVKLFERSHEGIELTSAGKILEQHITRTISDAERTMHEIAACRDGIPKGITIVGQESVIVRFLPPTLVALHAEYPDVATSFMATGGRRLNELVINGQADVALAFDPDPDPQVERVATISLEVGAVMAPTHPLAGRDWVSLRDCADYALILPDESWPLRDILDAEFQSINIDPGVTTSSNSVEFLRTMLAEETAVGFQTVIGIETAVEKGHLSHVPLMSDHPINQEFAVCAHRTRERSSVVDRILALLQQRLADYRR